MFSVDRLMTPLLYRCSIDVLYVPDLQSSCGGMMADMTTQ